MLLAAAGIYGVLNYWVSVRRKEIAIRQALGAGRFAILRWAGSYATLLVAWSIAPGAFGCWIASRWLRSLLFGISADSPANVFAAGVAVFGIVALAAGIPLWRAMSSDPLSNLRDA